MVWQGLVSGIETEYVCGTWNNDRDVVPKQRILRLLVRDLGC